MLGTQIAPEQLFYDFCLEDHIPEDHMLCRIDPFLDLSEFRATLKPYYSHLGRPSVDPELMIRMLIVGYCLGILPSGVFVKKFISAWLIGGSVVWD